MSAADPTPPETAPARRANPWTVALVTVYGTSLGLAAILGLVARGPADGSGPDLVLTVTALALLGAGIVLVGLHLAVRSVQWYLDPSSRAAPVPPAQRPPRQDF